MNEFQGSKNNTISHKCNLILSILSGRNGQTKKINISNMHLKTFTRNKQ